MRITFFFLLNETFFSFAAVMLEKVEALPLTFEIGIDANFETESTGMDVQLLDFCSFNSLEVNISLSRRELLLEFWIEEFPYLLGLKMPPAIGGL